MKWINAFSAMARRVATLTRNVLTPNVQKIIKGYLMGVCSLLLLGNTACSGSKIVKWREEVTLHDGSTIIAERSFTYGGGSREPGANNFGGTQGDKLDFKASDGHEIHWENPGHLLPMILDQVGDTFYLVTIPHVVWDYHLYDCPDPPYVFFKYAGDWQRIEYSAYPKLLEIRNLSVGVEGESHPAHTGFVTAQQIQDINLSKSDTTPQEVRRIIPSAPEYCGRRGKPKSTTIPSKLGDGHVRNQ